MVALQAWRGQVTAQVTDGQVLVFFLVSTEGSDVALVPTMLNAGVWIFLE